MFLSSENDTNENVVCNVVACPNVASKLVGFIIYPQHGTIGTEDLTRIYLCSEHHSSLEFDQPDDETYGRISRRLGRNPSRGRSLVRTSEVVRRR